MRNLSLLILTVFLVPIVLLGNPPSKNKEPLFINGFVNKARKLDQMTSISDFLLTNRLHQKDTFTKKADYIERAESISPQDGFVVQLELSKNPLSVTPTYDYDPEQESYVFEFPHDSIDVVYRDLLGKTTFHGKTMYGVKFNYWSRKITKLRIWYGGIYDPETDKDINILSPIKIKFKCNPKDARSKKFMCLARFKPRFDMDKTLEIEEQDYSPRLDYPFDSKESTLTINAGEIEFFVIDAGGKQLLANKCFLIRP